MLDHYDMEMDIIEDAWTNRRHYYQREWNQRKSDHWTVQKFDRRAIQNIEKLEKSSTRREAHDEKFCAVDEMSKKTKQIRSDDSETTKS